MKGTIDRQYSEICSSGKYSDMQIYHKYITNIEYRVRTMST